MQTPLPRFLSFDTTTSACSIALSTGPRLVGEINLDSPITHSVRLLPGIDYLLTQAGIQIEEIDAFAVINGPGSFTGIRIGLATAKGLAQAHQKPVIPISAFDAWAEKCSLRPGKIVPFIDARRHEVYAAMYDLTENPMKLLMPGLVGRPEAVLATLPDSDLVFVGDGALQYRSLIEQHPSGKWRVEESDLFLGRAMGTLAWRRWQEGVMQTPAEVQPVYLRKSDAELAWKNR